MAVSQCYVNQHTVSAEDLWDICRGKKSTLLVFKDTLCLSTNFLLEPGNILTDIGSWYGGTCTFRSFSSTSAYACFFFSGSNVNKFVH